MTGSLPFGWERRHLPDGKILYVNHDDQKTTYIDPRLAFAKECQSRKGLEDFRQRFDASSNALQILHGQAQYNTLGQYSLRALYHTVYLKKVPDPLLVCGIGDI